MTEGYSRKTWKMSTRKQNELLCLISGTEFKEMFGLTEDYNMFLHQIPDLWVLEGFDLF